MTGQLVCACGQPIKPCPDRFATLALGMCAGYVHVDGGSHACRGRDGLAEPAGGPS